MTKKLLFLTMLAFMSFEFSGLYGQLKVTGTISSGMVVQRQEEIPLWGETGAGEEVYAVMNGDSASATSEGSGKWVLKLPAMEAGGPYDLKIWSGNDTLRLNDIYVGDVWLASGQSNMAWALKDSDNATAVIAASENPKIRQYLVPRILGNEPRDQAPAGSEWMQADPEHSGNFSAVAYYFAKYLHEHLEIPIGILNSSYGGTRIETWMSKEMLGYDEQDITLGDRDFNQPTVCYNTMLHPLIHTPVKGVIWYQGESNIGGRETAEMYGGQLETLITSWRELWKKEDLPFIWVQLPNWGTEANESSPGSWDALPIQRASQSRTLSLHHTGEITAIDLGEIDVHPPIKEPVGQRLSLVARTLVYGDTIESAGPRYRSHRKMENGRIEVSFDHVADGLVAKETGDQSLRWFALAGSNGTFYKANAVIVGDRVEVWNTGISEPAFIRYAWEHNPYNTNFYNSEDLAARPFKVQINHPGFRLKVFKAIDYYLDKGESTLLTWEWNGAENLLINGFPVDSIGGWRIWPQFDSTFVLSAIDRQNPELSDSVSVTIRVQQPDPTIDISADKGDWLSPGMEVTLGAFVDAPLGGTISLVEFFEGEKKIASLSEEPYQTTWTAETNGSYSLHGRVTDQHGNSTLSDTIYKLVDNFDILRLEAENGTIKGGKRIFDDESVSNGQYVELSRDWTLTFPDIHMDSSQLCQLSFSTLLNYGSPKAEYFSINDINQPDLIFEAPDEENWVAKHLLIPLDSGNNSLTLKANWGYISLDYIEILYKASQSGPDTVTSASLPEAVQNFQVYPNPFSEICRITFDLPADGKLSLELFDMSGRKIKVLLDGEMIPGTHHLDFQSGDMEKGSYLLLLTIGKTAYRKKLILL